MKLNTNAFLNFTFIVGKILSSLMLVVVLLAFIGGAYMLISSTNSKLDIPQFEYFSTDSSSEQGDVIETPAQNNKYDEFINQMIKEENLNKEIKKSLVEFANALDRMDEVDTMTALNGLKTYYATANKKFASNENLLYEFLYNNLQQMEPYRYEYIYDEVITSLDPKKISSNIAVNRCILYSYGNSLESAIKVKEAQDATNANNQIIAGSVMGASLLLFVILLFLPVLIKIEENTRQKND